MIQYYIKQTFQSPVTTSNCYFWYSCVILFLTCCVWVCVCVCVYVHVRTRGHANGYMCVHLSLQGRIRCEVVCAWSTSRLHGCDDGCQIYHNDAVEEQVNVLETMESCDSKCAIQDVGFCQRHNAWQPSACLLQNEWKRSHFNAKENFMKHMFRHVLVVHALVVLLFPAITFVWDTGAVES